MKRLKLLWKILRLTGTDKIVSGFFVFLLLSTFVVMLVEPQIKNYGDALWFTFSSFTTIGYGDIVVTTFAGRVITMILALYGIIVVALIPGVLVSYFTEIKSMKENETIIQFLDKLENLPNLSKDELAKISDNVKQRRYKI
ncbi:MAG: potassium channel family protein [Anaerorhabdus sp.]|uniref:potassium channel family protein n=1 Tax=Anaerorhabdus sp. TaxID=1872524 RepID=UPI003A8B64EB